MPNVKHVSATVVCIGIQLMIAPALCLMAVVGTLLLLAFLSEPWSLAGLTTLILAVGLPLVRVRRCELPLYSTGTSFPAYQSDTQTPSGSVDRARVLHLNSKNLGTVLDWV